MCFFFFFNDTATTEIYTLSLHDALPISDAQPLVGQLDAAQVVGARDVHDHGGDRKSTRLNSSHLVISYAVFCLKKKKKQLCLPRASCDIISTRREIRASTLTHTMYCRSR